MRTTLRSDPRFGDLVRRMNLQQQDRRRLISGLPFDLRRIGKRFVLLVITARLFLGISFWRILSFRSSTMSLG